MIHAVALLLAFQLAGEIVARLSGLPLPGPVLGMAALMLAFLAWPTLHTRTETTANGLLGHLSLLFVPAGVGVVGHLGRLGANGAPILAAILVSTALAIAVGAGVFVAVARLTGSRP
jgi:holin-like protein